MRRGRPVLDKWFGDLAKTAQPVNAIMVLDWFVLLPKIQGGSAISAGSTEFRKLAEFRLFITSTILHITDVPLTSHCVSANIERNLSW